MAVTDWQFEVDGFAFGAGTDFGVVSVSGLRGMPDIRSQSIARDGTDGLFTSPDRAGGRTITFVLDLATVPGRTITDLVDTLAASTVPRSEVVDLFFGEPGHSPRSVRGRWRRGAPMMDQAYSLGYTRIPLEFACDDPHIYGPINGALVSLPIGGGVTLPVTMPVVFPGTTGGAQTITNRGNVLSRPVLAILGPAIIPRVTNTTTGEELAVFVQMVAGDVLTADCRARTLRLNDRPVRELLIPGSSWITLPPGDSRIAFAASDASPSSLSGVGVYYQDTWIS